MLKKTWNSSSFAGILLALTAALYSITPIHNGNFFWHLRNGLDIIETGEIRTEDPFTWTRQGVTWIQHEWLAEAAMAASWNLLGEFGPILLKALLIGLSVFLAFRASMRNGGKPEFAFVFGAIWLALAQPRWIVRPHVFSIFLFSVYLWILSLNLKKPMTLTLVLLPVQILWVNIHAGFVMGIFLSAIPAMETLFSRNWKKTLPWILPPVVMVAASGLHPNGFRTLEYLPGFLAQPLYKETIREWWSPFDPRYAPERAVSRTALLFTGLTLGTVCIMLFARTKAALGKLVALLILTLSTVFAARNGELLAPAMLAWIPGMVRVKVPRALALAVACAIIAVPFLYGVPREVGPAKQLGTGVDWSVYPVELCDLLQDNSEILDGAVLYNTNEISGYLQYRFGEELPLFMDGRCLLFPQSFYVEYLELAFPAGTNFRNRQYELMNRYGFNLMIYNTPEEGSAVYLNALLPGWKPLYCSGLVSAYAETGFLAERGLDTLGYERVDPYDLEELFSTPFYLVHSDVLPELQRLRATTGAQVFDGLIYALEFRNGTVEPAPALSGPSAHTLECWRLCRENRWEEAMEEAELSGDEQLSAAVGILSGVPPSGTVSLMGMPVRGQSSDAIRMTALWVTGNSASALEMADSVVESSPGWGVAHCGVLYSLAGRGEKAIETANKALGMAAGPVVLERVARIAYLEGMFENAADRCEQALALSRGFTGARLLLGNSLWRLNRPAEAVTEYLQLKESGASVPAYVSERIALAEELNFIQKEGSSCP